MAEGLHKEGIVPASTLDFEANGLAIGVGSQDVEGQPAQNGEVLWSIVLSRAVGVLGKMDVEHPMKPVLDTPMTAGDVQQPLWGDVFGQEVVAHDRSISALAPQVSSRCDPAHRSDAWKAVEGSQAGIAHDGRPPRFAPIVGGAVGLFDDAALARSCKLLRNRSEQPPTVCLDRQNIVAAAFAHGRRKGAVAMQRVGGNDAAFEGQKVQYFQSPRRLVPARRFLLGQSHPGFDRKDVDQLQRCGLATALVGPAQGLAVPATTPVSLRPLALAKAAMKRRKASSKACGLSRRNTRLNVSWLGMPCSRQSKSRNTPSFDRPNSSISEQLPAPHITAASEMNSTSSRSCLALSARGSANRRKAFLNFRIRLPP